MDSSALISSQRMREMGNTKSNAIYNPNEVRNPPPPRLDDPARDNDLEQYIRCTSIDSPRCLLTHLCPAKYEYKRFLNKNALAASKLGPSRSASSVTSRTNGTPAPQKPASTPPEPKTATDIAAAMFSTAKPQLQPRTAASPPVRSVSQPGVSQNSPKPSPAVVKQDGVWADLISLQEPSANASLPLQYQAASPNYTGITASSTMPARLPGMGPNPFGNMTGLSSAGSSVTPFQQQSFGTHSFTHQQPLQSQFLLPTSASTPSFHTTSPQIPSSFSASNSPLFQAHPQPQMSPGVPFYQPQPQQSSLVPSQSQPQFLSSSPNAQFLSSSPNPQFMSSHSPQLLSTTPAAQQNSTLQTGFNPNAGNGIGIGGVGVTGYLTPSPQPMVNGMPGQAQVSSMGMQQPNQMFGGLAQSQQAPTMGNNPFGQMQFGQGGFPGQAGAQWGPL